MSFTMSKIIYESILVVFSSTVIFGSTLLFVLLILLKPENDTVGGVGTKTTQFLCVAAVSVFAFGLVGTISESFQCLFLYGALVLIFPFGVMLTHVLIRLTHHKYDITDRICIVSLFAFLLQTAVAFLLARRLRTAFILNRGIDYKVCYYEDMLGSQVQLCQVNHADHYDHSNPA